MPRILKRDEVAKITFHNHHPVFVEIDELAYTLAVHDDLIAAMTAELRRANPETLLVKCGERVGLGCFDEHDLAALGRWEEKNGMVRK